MINIVYNNYDHIIMICILQAHFNNYNILSMFKVAEGDKGINIIPERLPLKAGDCIIVDTSGIHGATDLLEGRRVQLGLVYEQKGFGAIDTFS